MSGKIGYDELFDFENDSQFVKAVENVKNFAESYEKASKAIKDSMNEIKAVNKSMAESILDSSEKVNAQTDQNRQEIINQAKAAEVLVESNKKLVKSEQDLAKADIEYERTMRIMTESMKSNGVENTKLKLELDKLKESQKSIKKEYELGRVSQEKYVETLSKQAAKERELKAEISGMEAQLKAQTKEVQSSFTSYNQMNLSLGRLKKQYKDLSDEERDNLAIGGDLLKQIAEYDSKLKAIDATMGDNQRHVGNYAKASNTLKIEMRETIAAMAQMQMAGEQDSAAYQEMAQKAGDLRNQLDDVRAEIKMLASDTRAFDTLIQGAEGVTASFGLAQAGAALLGVEDEKLEKSMQKLQSVMVALQSLQSIQNILQKESAVYQGVTLLQKKAAVLYTNLETAAQSKNIVVKYSAVAAQWALNLAMEANPAVLLITVFLALTAVFLAFALASDTASESQSKFNEAQKIGIERAERQFELTQKNSQDRLKSLENELALMKAQGKSQSEIYAKENEILQLKSKMANSAKGWYSDEIANLNKNRTKLNELKKVLEDYNEAKANDTRIEVIVDYKTGETKRKKVDEEDIKAVEGLISNLAAVTEKSQSTIDEATQTSVDIQTKAEEEKRRLVEAGLKSNVAAIDAQLIAVKKGTKKELDLKIQAAEADRRQALNNVNLTVGEIANINAKARNDVKKATEEYNKAVLEDQLALINTNMVGAKKNSETEFNLKKAQIQKQLQLSLNGDALSSAQRKLLTVKANQDIEDLTRQHELTLKTIALENQINIKEALITSSIEGSEERYNLEVQLQDQLLELEKLKINSSIELTDLQKQALLSKAEAETEASKKALSNQLQLAKIAKQTNAAETAESIEKMNLQFQLTNGNFNQRKQAYQRLEQLNKDVLDREFNDLEELHKKGLIAEDAYLAKKNELTEKAEQDRLALLQASADQEKSIRDAVMNAGQELITAGFDYFKAVSDAKLANLQKQMDYEVSMAGDNTAQKTIIEEKYQKKMKAEKKKAAIFEKAQALFSAAVNTGVAITAALRVPVIGPALAIIAGVLGAAQIAFIAAKPLPAFAKGTKNAPTGYAWVGEQGSELKEDRFGNYSLTSNKASIDYLKGGEKIYTANSPETNLFRSVLNGNDVDGSNGSSTYKLNEIAFKIAQMKDDRDRSVMSEMLNRTNMSDLKAAFKEAVSEIPVHENNWDENGFTNYTRTKNKRVEQMNNRFKTGGQG